MILAKSNAILQNNRKVFKPFEKLVNTLICLLAESQMRTSLAYYLKLQPVDS